VAAGIGPAQERWKAIMVLWLFNCGAVQYLSTRRDAKLARQICRDTLADYVAVHEELEERRMTKEEMQDARAYFAYSGYERATVDDFRLAVRGDDYVILSDELISLELSILSE
jgi:hypothetical protein